MIPLLLFRLTSGAAPAAIEGDLVTIENAYFRRTATTEAAVFVRSVTAETAMFRRTVTTEDGER